MACGLAPDVAAAVNVLFAEDFENVPLFTSPTYQLPAAWSPVPPSGWDSIDEMPGLGDPQVGVTEFEGWTFWRKQLWQLDQVTGDPQGGVLNRRQRFDRGEGTIAVADPDTWNDLGNPAERGRYNTFLITPEIDLTNIPRDDYKLVLSFDTSWQGGCCEDPEFPSNQTAIIRARVDGGAPLEVFRWESAPFFDNLTGRPTREPIDATGNANQPNDAPVVPREFDERVSISAGLSDLLDPPALASLGAAAAASGGGSLQLEFAMEDAGDDGWWAVDNLELASIPAPMDGDLYIDGVLDSLDIDQFAYGLLDERGYEDAWAGESPASRGSPDSVFDFDDIPWFLGVMEAAMVPKPAFALSQALYGIPEPTAGVLAAAALLASSAGRRGGGR